MTPFDAKARAYTITDDFEGRKLTKGQSACLAVRIAAALAEARASALEEAAKIVLSPIGSGSPLVAADQIRALATKG